MENVTSFWWRHNCF